MDAIKKRHLSGLMVLIRKIKIVHEYNAHRDQGFFLKTEVISVMINAADLIITGELS